MGAGELSQAREKALTVYQVLLDTYGEVTRRNYGDPVSELVRTILSQNTSDHNSDQAFQDLRKAYPSWEQVLHAPADEIADAIRYGGLAEQKAPRIQGALERILDEAGAFDLGFLKGMLASQARDWLTGIKGVGPKTASIVLLFTLDMPAFPVDTHVHRVSLRVGLIPEKTSPERAGELYEEMLPEELYYPYHKLLIQHGRQVCKAARPRCEACSISAHCAYYAAVGSA